MNRRFRTILTTLVMILFIGSFASAEGWEKSLDLDLTATQASYSDNWTGGEVGNFTWVSNANGTFNKQLKKWFLLKNKVKLSFGQTLTQNQDTKDWSKPIKSSDKIDLEAVGLFTVETFVEPYSSLRFESQFLDASDEANKQYIDPILLTLSGGVARQILKKDKDDILTRLGLAIRFHRDKMVDSTYSYDDGGLESNTDIKLVLSDKMSYVGKLVVYKAFFFSKKDDFKGMEEEDYWKAIDINWENQIVASISKYVQVSFYTQLLYDKQISKKGRFKETLSLGLTYKLL